MAGTITKLEVQKKNKERVNVFIDGDYALAVTLQVALELKKGQHLSDAEIERLQQQDQRHKAYQRALSYLSFRARSRVEMERYLRGKKVEPEVIADTLQRLAEENLLDDTAFAEAWVEDRSRFKPKSAQALRYELRQKGLTETDIEQALTDLDEADLAWQALEPKLYRWQSLEEQDFRKKAMGFLSRRGFSYEIVRQAVERGWQTCAKERE